MNVMRTIHFAGYSWEAKESVVPIGPGPNIFSGAEEYIQVDESGLKLSIQESRGAWQCAEVVLTEPLSFGTYEFVVETPLTGLEGHAVFGAFLYENDVQEIDIKASPVMVGEGLGQFVIQPGTARENLHRYPLPPGAATHHIIWLPDRTDFLVREATRSTVKPQAEWTYPSSGIRGPENARFIFNLWLYRGKPVSKPQEVLISSFTFTPHVHVPQPAE